MSRQTGDEVIAEIFQHYDGKGRPSTGKRTFLYVWLLEASEEARRVRKAFVRPGLSWEEKHAIDVAADVAGQRVFDDYVAQYEAKFGRSIFEPFPESTDDNAS